ncbi:MAG: hypothetical protein N4A74_20350 [Carboxylicivirga sp.]|nr:hypothetical protein [Carboxylicivirga sp.]
MKSIGNSDLLWSYASQIFQYGSGLFILPFVLSKLSPDELGVWYVFIAINSLLLILDSSFNPNIMRSASYLYSGAQDIAKKGYDVCGQTSGVNIELLGKLLFACKYLYRYIGLVAFFLLATIGSYYIFIISDVLSQKSLFIRFSAWIIYAIGIILNLYYGYYNAFLMANEQIKETQQGIVFSKLVFLFVSFVLVILDYGLLGLAIGQLLSVIVLRFYYRKVFYRSSLIRDIMERTYKQKEIVKVVKALWPNSWRLLINSIGGYLILQGNTILCSLYISLADTAAYGLSLQVFNVISNVSLVYFKVHIPYFSKLRITNGKETLTNRYGVANTIAILLFFSGMLVVLLFGNKMLDFIGSNIKLLSLPILSIIAFYMLLNLIHGIAATFLTTKNYIPFVFPTIISGVVITFSTALLLNVTNLNLYALVLPTLIVPLFYNNWKWPLEVAKDLECNFFKIFPIGLKQLTNELFTRS